MTIVNGYITAEQLNAVLGIDDVDDLPRVEGAIAAASRQIDAHCGRRFWQDALVATRQYAACESQSITVDDISTTVGLIVKLDEADTGSFATTLTVTTDYILAPFNAATRVPVWPYTEIIFAGGYRAPQWSSGRPGVQVTAKFGWPAVPDDVAQACVVQAKNIYKASSGTFSGFQLSVDAGVAMRIPGMDGVAVALLEPYRKVSV